MFPNTRPRDHMSMASVKGSSNKGSGALNVEENITLNEEKCHNLKNKRTTWHITEIFYKLKYQNKIAV